MVGVGLHYFYAIDDNQCISTPVSLDVQEPEELKADLNIINGFISCNGDANGILSATASGGLDNYSYTLLDDNGSIIQGPQLDNRFEGIDVGTYTIQVTSDGYGTSPDCIVNTGFHRIEQPEAIVIDYQVIPPTCFDTLDGIITLDVEGGTGEYTYRISSDLMRPQQSNVFANLAPGDYTIIVQDENGCIEDVDVEIIAPDEIIPTFISVTQQICIEDPAPSARIAISGGTEPYIIFVNGSEHTSVTSTGEMVPGTGAVIL